MNSAMLLFLFEKLTL